MTVTREDLDNKWAAMFLHCKNEEAAKNEVLATLSKEPDEEHEWTEQDIYEQMRMIIRNH